MEKEIYTAQERNLIEGAKQIQAALETKQALLAALELDLLLLDMESKQFMMDGVKL